jgi:hypothetical protein
MAYPSRHPFDIVALAVIPLYVRPVAACPPLEAVGSGRTAVRRQGEIER